MASIYSQIEETIKKAQEELQHLNNERNELRKAEKDIPRASYITEDASIRDHIARQQQIIEENERILDAYNKARDLILNRAVLEDELRKARDDQDRQEIRQEMDAKEQELAAHRALMSPELQEELRQSILNQNQNTNEQNNENVEEITNEQPQQEQPKVEETQTQESQIIDNTEEIERLQSELEDAKRLVQTQIDKMRAIYSDTQVEFEEGEWTKTADGFDNFVEQYIEKMRAEDTIYIEAQKRVQALERQIAGKKKEEKQSVERARLEQEAKDLNITFEQYQKIVRAANNRNIFRPVFEQMGLGEILSKRGRTKEERSRVNAARQELIERLVEVQQRSEETINIRETIDVLYGTDLSVRRSGKAREIKVTGTEIQNIVTNAEKVPKRLVKDPNYTPNYTPGQRPADIPRGTETPVPRTPEVPRLPSPTEVPRLSAPAPVLGLPSPEPVLGLPAPTEVPRLPGPAPVKRPVEPVVIPKEPIKKPVEPVVTPKEPIKKPIEPVVPVVPVVTPKPKPTPKPEPKPEPKPTPVPIKPTPEPTPEPKKPQIGLMQTIEKITRGVEVSRKDGKAYQASNIKIAQNFKNELHSGNYLYNIVHLVPAIVKVPFQFLTKISGKLRFTKESKQRIKTMKERIEKLSEEELMVIYDEYRGNRVMQERLPSAINILLQEKIEQFIMAKVTALNAQLEADYADIFNAMMELEAVDHGLVNGNFSKEDKEYLTSYRQQLLQGRAEQVKRIRDNYKEAQRLLSGGLNGFSQDMKAATTKLSIVGKRFAKDQDLDLELLSKEAKLEKAEMAAIEEGNDQMALLTFIQAESLLSKETEISNSIFGKRSTGKKYYSPLAEKLDYRDDPFIKDLFTTVAVTSAALSTINAIKGAPTSAEIEEANRQIQEAQDFVDQVKGHRGTMREGMEAQGIQGTSTITGEVERGALDATGWGLGTSRYRAADNAGHDFYNQVFDSTKAEVQNISQQYMSGSITELEALSMMRDMANNTQATLTNVSEQCIGIFEQYAQTHPQFDLTAVTEAVRYIEQHPDAIANMNNAMVDIQTAAEGLTLTQIQALQTVPNSLLVTLLGTASAAALASNINQKMEANVKAGKYGNSVTDLVDEYVAEHTEEEENTHRK